MARPNKINGNQFRNEQQAKLDASGLVTKYAGFAITRLDAALQTATENLLPIGTEITRTYTSLEPGAVFFTTAQSESQTATKELAAVVLAHVKGEILGEFTRRGFTVTFEDTKDSAGVPFHYVTIA